MKRIKNKLEKKCAVPGCPRERKHGVVCKPHYQKAHRLGFETKQIPANLKKLSGDGRANNVFTVRGKGRKPKKRAARKTNPVLLDATIQNYLKTLMEGLRNDLHASIQKGIAVEARLPVEDLAKFDNAFSRLEKLEKELAELEARLPPPGFNFAGFTKEQAAQMDEQVQREEHLRKSGRWYQSMSFWYLVGDEMLRSHSLAEACRLQQEHERLVQAVTENYAETSAPAPSEEPAPSAVDSTSNEVLKN